MWRCQPLSLRSWARRLSSFLRAAICLRLRRTLGFSILEVVRTNPTTLQAQGITYRHPSGVLHLTQFTQVAMATGDQTIEVTSPFPITLNPAELAQI